MLEDHCGILQEHTLLSALADEVNTRTSPWTISSNIDFTRPCKIQKQCGTNGAIQMPFLVAAHEVDLFYSTLNPR